MSRCAQCSGKHFSLLDVEVRLTHARVQPRAPAAI